ncbi:MAG: GntR family transcriptional regulator [Treponema sp.]|jgi:GntR family transcriptional regulator|nr:GntR family transcriptional regulator [Treponema sp.]
MNSTNAQGTIHFSLDAASGVPVYRQIIQQIEYAILSGRIQTGDRLPTIRSLAVTLKINPNTIAKAYGELEIRGIVSTQVGSGTYISDQKPLRGGGAEDPAEDPRKRKIEELLGRFIQEMKNLGVGKQELITYIEAYDKSW